MSALVSKSLEEYEDDFEKDLDWLISEESRGEEDHGADHTDIEAEIDKELQREDEKRQEMKRKPKGIKREKRGDKTGALEEGEERWPSPMEPLQCNADRDSPSKSPPTAPPPPGMDDQTDEDKEYILEKIQQANRELRDQELPDMTRRRRLHFKEKLVDLVVPLPRFESDGGEVGGGGSSKDRAKCPEAEVSGKLSELKLSPGAGKAGSGGYGRAAEGGGGGGRQEVKDDRVLMEKDGKFELVSMNEVESRGRLPPLARDKSDGSQQAVSSSKSHRSSSSPRPRVGSLSPLRAPGPPARPGSRPNSAIHGPRGGQGSGGKRRVQSASGTTCKATYALSPQQKELLQKSQERKEKLAREAEQKKREEEEQRRHENELAFKAWLMKKREQFQEEKRIQRAQEMEKMNSKRDPSDPEESFRLWLQRKQEQQQRERQMVELKKLEEDSDYLSRSREDCERAFEQWLKRKSAERRAEQRAARECSRRLVVEERRARRVRDLLCVVNETKPFRFTEQLAYPL